MPVMQTKTRPLRSLLAVAVFAVAGTAGAQQTQLNPQAKRISDEAIHADLESYEATQGRIQALNDGGRPIRDYHLSKAQCWLDVSFHEYSRNDRSAFPQEALTESEKLIVGMERGVAPLPTDTPLVNNAARVREDLWKRLGAIHGTPGFACAQQAVAIDRGRVHRIARHLGHRHRLAGQRQGRWHLGAVDHLRELEARHRHPEQ